MPMRARQNRPSRLKLDYPNALKPPTTSSTIPRLETSTRQCIWHLFTVLRTARKSHRTAAQPKSGFDVRARPSSVVPCERELERHGLRLLGEAIAGSIAAKLIA